MTELRTEVRPCFFCECDTKQEFQVHPNQQAQTLTSIWKCLVCLGEHKIATVPMMQHVPHKDDLWNDDNYDFKMHHRWSVWGPSPVSLFTSTMLEDMLIDLGLSLGEETVRQRVEGNDELADKLVRYGKVFEEIFSGGTE